MILHEAPLNPKTHTERLAQIHFESFGTPSLLMSPPSGYLSLLYVVFELTHIAHLYHKKNDSKKSMPKYKLNCKRKLEHQRSNTGTVVGQPV